jgi:hypothetical protein
MPDLSFQIEGVQAVRLRAPLLGFDLRVTNTAASAYTPSPSGARSRLRRTRRRYGAKDQERLQDLFGEPHRWGQTLRTMLWTQASVDRARFHGRAPCGAAGALHLRLQCGRVKYFQGLEEGEIPLCFQFSGTVFYESATGACRSRRFLGQGGEVPAAGQAWKR